MKSSSRSLTEPFQKGCKHGVQSVCLVLQVLLERGKAGVEGREQWSPVGKFSESFPYVITQETTLSSEIRKVRAGSVPEAL